MSKTYYLGECDVCGQAIASSFDWAKDGIIDHVITDDGRQQTWIRHFSVAPNNANPDCAKYSSKVYEVTPLPELSQRLSKTGADDE